MRSSQWEVIHRCLRVLTRLQRTDTSKEDLLSLGYEGTDIDKQLENDLRRLREHFQVVIEYDRSTKKYRLHDLGNLPLFDLPPGALEGLNFLTETFTPASPHYRQVQALLEALKLRLPSDQLQKLNLVSVQGLELRQLDSDLISDVVFEKLSRAYRERRKVEFDYRSPQRNDESTVRHTVWATQPRFDTMRGHHYMRAYCEATYSEERREWHPRKYYAYRLGRIVPASIQILPNRYPISPPTVPQYEVIYWLAPSIARYGVSQRFDSAEVEYHNDGSATVYAKTDDVFSGIRSLLTYGANCHVLGGKAFLAEFRQLVMDMAGLYANNFSDPHG